MATVDNTIAQTIGALVEGQRQMESRRHSRPITSFPPHHVIPAPSRHSRTSYRHSRTSYRHSRESGNPESPTNSKREQSEEFLDSRLRGNDVVGAGMTGVDGRPTSSRLTGQVLIQVSPCRVGLFYQREFPGPVPAFEGFLASDGAIHECVWYRLLNPSITSCLCCQMRCVRLEVTPIYRVPLRLLARM